ncbi:MAG: hypothetical protein KBD24_01860 [Candidatus Pacebacteria bacterium]|nr:hypothetical protein [Candidatus Paceibacterota bacterium]
MVVGWGWYYYKHFELAVTNETTANEIGDWLFTMEISEMVLRAAIVGMSTIADAEALDDAFSAFDPFNA